MVVQSRLLKVDATAPSGIEARPGVVSLRHDAFVVGASANRFVARVARVAQSGRRRDLALSGPSREGIAAHASAAAPRAQLVLDEILRDFGAETQAGQAEGEEVADRGEAGAEDGAVDFDHGPDRRVVTVPRGIVFADDEVESRRADDGYDAGAMTILVTRGAEVFRRDGPATRNSKKYKKRTYKNPKPKTMINRIFWRRGSCSELMSGIGSAKTMKSVVMLMPAAMYQIVRLSIHVLAMEGKSWLMGTQPNETRMDWTMFHVQAKAMMQNDVRCSHTAGKMRRYWSKRLTLTRQRAQMYVCIAPNNAWSCRTPSSGLASHECLPTPQCPSVIYMLVSRAGVFRY